MMSVKNRRWHAGILGLLMSLVILLAGLVLSGCGSGALPAEGPSAAGTSAAAGSGSGEPSGGSSGEAADSSAALQDLTGAVSEEGSYTSKEDVSEYLHTYGHLPSNFITKKEAQALGWDSSAGNLDEVAPGKSIGGDRFGNYEGLLPEKSGRKYYECDINYSGGYRGGERIVYSSDGLIFYTEDHYRTFEQLY